MGHTIFKGTGVAMVTPFTNNNTVDTNAFEKLLKHIVEGGVNYVVFFGTTGESATVSHEEKLELLKLAASLKKGNIKYVLGVGGNNTFQLIDELHSYELNGIDGILSVSPYYNKPSQEGLYLHYKTFADNCDLPVILYNVPARTSSNLSATTALKLANDCENIIAVKEASGNFEQCMDLIVNKPEGFLVLSGDDMLTLPLISAGMDGVISVIGNAYPAQFSEMVNLALEGNFEGARNQHYNLYQMMKLLCCEGNPAGIKALLHQMGIIQNNFRLPLNEVSQSLYNDIKSCARNVK